MLSDDTKRKEYDEARNLMSSGAFRGFRGAGRWRRGRRRRLRHERHVPQRRAVAGGPVEPAGSATCSAACSTGGAGRPAPAAAGRARGADVRDRGADRVRRRRHRSDGAARHHRADHLPDLSRRRRQAGYLAARLPGVQRNRADHPQPGIVRLLRAVLELPRHRVDHRRPVPDLSRRAHGRAQPPADHPHPGRGRRRSADQAGGQGRARTRWRPRRRSVCGGACVGTRVVRSQRRQPHADAFR